VAKYDVRCGHGAIRHNMRTEVKEIRIARLLNEKTQTKRNSEKWEKLNAVSIV
jgi:hypothetical protein